MKMKKKPDFGREPSVSDLAEAERIAALHPIHQNDHSASLPADLENLPYINFYGERPDCYVDTPNTCCCGKREILRAAVQDWYSGETKGHITAPLEECQNCRAQT